MAQIMPGTNNNKKKIILAPVVGAWLAVQEV